MDNFSEEELNKLADLIKQRAKSKNDETDVTSTEDAEENTEYSVSLEEPDESNEKVEEQEKPKKSQLFRYDFKGLFFKRMYIKNSGFTVGREDRVVLLWTDYIRENFNIPFSKFKIDTVVNMYPHKNMTMEETVAKIYDGIKFFADEDESLIILYPNANLIEGMFDGRSI